MTSRWRFAAALICALPAVTGGVRAVEVREREVGGVAYRHITCEARELHLHWKDGKGVVMRTFAAVAKEIQAKGREPVFLMNGGIFEPGGIPSGLLVIQGKEFTPLNLKEGKGNFYLRPNGVFFVADGEAGVANSNWYRAHPPAGKISLAVQSGPLLVDRGRIHPAFREVSPNRLHRNGVGVDKSGLIHFLITSRERKALVNLFGFASAFRELGCSNALFLDGDISQCFVQGDPALRLQSNRFGTIISASRAANGEEKARQ